jgi:fucose permease
MNRFLLGGTNLLLTMWGGNAAAPLNTVHLGYGIGAVLVNFLVRPFITEKVLSDDDPVDSSTLSSVNEITAKSNIFVPYTITAVLCVLIAVGHIFYYIRELIPQKQKLEVRQVMMNQRETIEF